MKRHIEYPRQSSMVQPDVLNPFVHRLKLSTLDIIQVAIMSVTIVPLRLLLVGLMLLMVWPLAAIGVAFRSPQERNKPLTGWRWQLSKVLRFLLRAIYFVFGFHCIHVGGHKVDASEAPIVCVAPHSSIFDLYVILSDSHLGSAVSRQENVKIPIIGRIIEFSQPVLVSREDPNSRLNTIKEIQCRSRSGGQWPQIFIFPEGTCSNRSCLISFKGGAFFPGVPVQPVCLRYNHKKDTMTWTWDGPGAFKCLWLTLCQFQSHMEIEFLPVYKPSPEEIADPKLFANNVRKVMAEHLKIPVTDHTYDDCRLMAQAKKLQLPMEAGIVEFQKLHKKLGVNFDQMRELLLKFRAMDNSHTGQITLQQFASYLRLPESPALLEVFQLYDRDESGTIDFREYVIGLSLVSNPANTEDTLQHAFQLFDKENKGYITQFELQIILHNAFSMDEDQVIPLFQNVDTDNDGRITYEDFRAYAEAKPEYAKLFVTYHDISNGHAVNSDTVEKVSSSSTNGKPSNGKPSSKCKTTSNGTNSVYAADGKLKAQ